MGDLIIYGMLGMIFAGVIMVLFIVQINNGLLKKIYAYQKATMAFLLKEYEEGIKEVGRETPRTGERLLKPDDPMVKIAVSQPGVELTDLQKRQETRRKTAEKKRAAQAAASGT
jgi:hypothetical protein